MTNQTGSDDEGVKLTELQSKRRGQRNLAIGLALLGFVCLFYAMTIVKLSGGLHH